MRTTTMLPFLFSLLFGGCRYSAEDAETFAIKRREMIDRQIIARGITDTRVIAAMNTVPRHLFIPRSNRNEAYEDRPVPIGNGQTISQPYIVACMTEMLGITPTDRVLEIGTGSGYQAAVLAEIASAVYTIEIIPDLAARAQRLLEDDLGYTNIHFRVGDGYAGWPESAPFDAIIATAAPESIPQALIDQLAEGGRIVIPVGGRWGIQSLTIGTRKNGELVTREVMSVRFVPMVTDE